MIEQFYLIHIGTTNLSKIEPKSNRNEGILHNPQNSRASQSDTV